MNAIMKAAQQLLQARNTHRAREARSFFLQHYHPQEAQELLLGLHCAWQLHCDLDNEPEMQRFYHFYRHLAQLLAAEYTLLKEGRRWPDPVPGT